MMNEQKPIVVFMSSYPPRECGIATFTEDLVRAIAARNPSFTPKILALNDTATSFYQYPTEVFLQITDTDERAFINVADIVNRLDRVIAVNIQHEFGLYGGSEGSHLVGFVMRLKKPILTTFHTVLAHPNERQRTITQLLLKRSQHSIAMTRRSREILRSVYGATRPISVIPHGIPSVTYEPSASAKQMLGFAHHLVLSTFGLLNEKKGIEYALDALPEVVRRFPHVLYLIIGETHPVVRRREGERYRKMLMRRVLHLKLQEHVKFYDRYLSLSEVLQFLQATDIYIAPSLDPEQAVSGTLSYALGVGRPVIATPFSYAEDLVTPSVGIRVPFRDAASLARALLTLCSDEHLRATMGQKAYKETRAMLWSDVAAHYVDRLQEYVKAKRRVPSLALPALSLRHLERLTDARAIVQFARGIVPDRSSGYTVDDTARALLVTAQWYVRAPTPPLLALLRRYLTFLNTAQRDDGSFINYFDTEGRATAQNAREDTRDATGRAIWGLGVVVATERLPLDCRRHAEALFERALRAVRVVAPLRTLAFTLLGVARVSAQKQEGRYRDVVVQLADTLVRHYVREASSDWQWFEPRLTYANAVVPHALIAAYRAVHNDQYRNVAKKTIDFLLEKTLYNTFYMPIGTRGWCVRGRRCAHFDQQPEDPGAMTLALLALYDATKEEQYRMYALRVFAWFLGENVLRRHLYDAVSGGCHDGLSPTAVNPNQGAESTIMYLLARCAIEPYV